MIILASASPRRAELLKLITPDFEIVKSNISEDISLSDSKAMVEELSKRKAHDVFSKRKNSLVIGADTLVEIKNKAFGKPKDMHDAENMLFMLSGSKHLVHTGVCALYNDEEITEVVTTEVYFNHISNKEIKEYLETENYMDKAGAYAIQEGAAKFVQKINGCYFNVMGLPVSKVYNIIQMLQKIY